MNDPIEFKRTHPANRLVQQTPDALIHRLMCRIRHQFCAALDDKTWYQDHYHFIRKNVVMWPAREICANRGFTLPAERYEKIMVMILDEVEQNGHVDNVNYWPAYLMKCIQTHWRHHWEEYYAEAKAVRNLTERSLVALGSLGTREDQTVEAVAMAHRVLSAAHKTRKKPAPLTQLSLFGNSK